MSKEPPEWGVNQGRVAYIIDSRDEYRSNHDESTLSNMAVLDPESKGTIPEYRPQPIVAMGFIPGHREVSSIGGQDLLQRRGVATFSGQTEAAQIHP